MCNYLVDQVQAPPWRVTTWKRQSSTLPKSSHKKPTTYCR
jgi:hypothetical protein